MDRAERAAKRILRGILQRVSDDAIEKMAVNAVREEYADLEAEVERLREAAADVLRAEEDGRMEDLEMWTAVTDRLRAALASQEATTPAECETCDGSFWKVCSRVGQSVSPAEVGCSECGPWAARYEVEPIGSHYRRPCPDCATTPAEEES